MPLSPDEEQEAAGPGHWARKVAVFPIGERFATISLTAAVFDARVTFVVLLVCGGLGVAYATVARLVRTLGRRRDTALPSGRASRTMPLVRDDGPLATAVGRAARGLRLVAPEALAAAAVLGLLAGASTGGRRRVLDDDGAIIAWSIALRRERRACSLPGTRCAGPSRPC